MKKIKIFAILDVGVMVVLLFLVYITDCIQRHDTSIYAGLSPMGFWSVLFLLIFFIAAAIFSLLLYIIITVHFINKSMRPLKIIAIIDGVIMTISALVVFGFNYLYSIKDLLSNWISGFLLDVFSWSLLISLATLVFITIVCISVFIIRKIKK